MSGRHCQSVVFAFKGRAGNVVVISRRAPERLMFRSAAIPIVERTVNEKVTAEHRVGGWQRIVG